MDGYRVYTVCVESRHVERELVDAVGRDIEHSTRITRRIDLGQACTRQGIMIPITFTFAYDKSEPTSFTVVGVFRYIIN